MRLILTNPPGKNYMLIATDLEGDNHFCPARSAPWHAECENSQRWKVDRIINKAAKTAGVGNQIFNQLRWSGTTGWELWTDDQDKILEVVLLVSERLQISVDMEGRY